MFIVCITKQPTYLNLPLIKLHFPILFIKMSFIGAGKPDNGLLDLHICILIFSLDSFKDFKQRKSWTLVTHETNTAYMSMQAPRSFTDFPPFFSLRLRVLSIIMTY